MNELAPRIETAQTAHEPYPLEEFGRIEFRDPVVPIQILMVMMGFAIQSINNVFQDQHWNAINATGILCGVCYLLAYMFYLAEYYDRLWEPYFLLAEDKIFFRFYSIAVGVVAIALLSAWPQYWGLYILALFLIMFMKKRITRDTYCEAVRRRYGNFESCPDAIVKAKYRLAEAFTMNFLIWGFWFFVPFAIFMAASAFFSASPLRAAIPYISNIDADHFKYAYVASSVFITLLTIFFWKNKITRGIYEMRRRVEMGDHEYFKNM